MRRMIELSLLSAGRRNPRRVRCEREAHRRLVASIRSVGLMQPLIVRPAPGKGYTVVAGKRRLEALREVHRGLDKDPQIKCEVEDIDDSTADTMALAENFAREGMHPLDEAEAFAKLADSGNKGVAAVAAEFGVTARYVKQRMKLAGLADTIKVAYREGEIDTGTAEVFSSVPPARQMEAWDEADGKVRHMQHARNLIEQQWIDAKLARFDVGGLPDAAVSRDLFGDRVLIERGVFMQAQADTIEAESHQLGEDGWGEVVVARRDEVYDRLRGMETPGPDYDEATQAQLTAIIEQRQALEQELDKVDEDDESTTDALYEQIEALDEQEDAVAAQAEPIYAEAIKAVGTVFLLLDPDGTIHREFRVPKPSASARRAGTANGQDGHVGGPPPSPMSDDISERQQKAVLVQETLALRSVLLGDDEQAERTRRALLVLMLSGGDAVLHGGGLLTQGEVDPVARYIEVQAGLDKPVTSEAWDTLSARQKELDPFKAGRQVEIDKAYQRVQKLNDEQLDGLIDLLIVQNIAGALHQRSGLIAQLVSELGVELRAFWTPDADWFAGYKKIQLAHLIGRLQGKAHGHAAERSKKSELVEHLAKLFVRSRDGQLEDTALAAKVNAWLPSCVRTKRRKTKAAA